MIRRDSARPGQFSFAEPRAVVAFSDLDGALRDALGETLGETLALAKSKLGLDRHAVAAEVNRLQPSERELSKNVLDRWCAPSATDWQLPAHRVPALCRITGDYTLLSVLVDASGHKAIPNEAAAVAEMVMLELEEKRLRERREAIAAALPEAALDWTARSGVGGRGL